MRVWGGDGVALGICDGGDLAYDDGLTAVTDGLVYNPDDVACFLAIAQRPLPNDAALLLAAYRRLGEDLLAPFAGCFAFALWDGRERRLILGREPLGTRPLHFSHAPGGVLFASERRGLYPCLGRPELNEAHFLRSFADLPETGSSTWVRGIERVLPGHLALFDRRGVRQKRWWRPEELPTVRFSRDEDYADALYEALDEATRRCLPATGEVALSLSGGLDSTGVGALTARRLGETGRRLTAFTAVPVRDPKTDPVRRISDEGPLAAALVRRYPNIDHILVPTSAGRLFDTLDRIIRDQDETTTAPTATQWGYAICDAVAARGIGHHMNAGFGNISSSFDGLYLLSARLRQGRPLAWARQAGMLRRVQGWAWSDILHVSVGPLLPVPWREAILRAFGRPVSRLYDRSPINPALARHHGIEDEVRRQGDNTFYAVSNSHDLRLRMLHYVDRGSIACTRRFYGATTIDPTGDRHLLELCLRIPDEQFFYRGQPRSLIRRAMAGIVPAEILQERRHGLQAADWFDRLTDVRDEIAAEISWAGRSPLACHLLDVARLKRLVEDWPTGEDWRRPEVRWHYSDLLEAGIGASRFLRRFEVDQPAL